MHRQRLALLSIYLLAFANMAPVAQEDRSSAYQTILNSENPMQKQKMSLSFVVCLKLKRVGVRQDY